MEFKSIFSEDSLDLAFERLKTLKKAGVEENFGKYLFESNYEKNIQYLSKRLLEGQYHPSNAIKYYKNKPNGRLRTISFFEIEDSIVYQTIGNYLGYKAYDSLSRNYDVILGMPLHEDVSLGNSIINEDRIDYFFYRPWTECYKKFSDSANDAKIKGECVYALETDLSGFYDNIPHFNFFDKLEEIIDVNVDVIKLLENCLNKWSGSRDSYTPNVGIPQTSITSPLISNLILHHIDEVIITSSFRYYRYIDDIRIYGYNIDEMEQVLVNLELMLKSINLTLNSSKTRIKKIKTDENIIIFNYGFEDDSIEKKDNIRDDSFEELAIRQIKDSFSELSKLKDNYSEIEKDITDSDEKIYLDHAYDFRMGVSFLIENTPTNFEINDYDHDLWLFFLNLLPHRIENLCWTLNFYLGNTELKNKLTKLIRRYKAYEWMVYNLIKCISNIHTIQKSELSFYLSMIDNNSPWIVKKSIYEYLFRDADESYDKRSLLNKLKNEKLFLRKIIIDFILKNTIEINREEIWRVLK